MEKELIINSGKKEVLIALLENGKLSELHKESSNKKFSVGDLYLGKVKKTAQGLNAAFINIGHEKDAFLHYHDLGTSIKNLLKFISSIGEVNPSSVDLSKFSKEKEIEKSGSIEQVLSVGKNILAQIVKEPISNKGPRLTSEISIAGRYLILMPFSNKVSISQKIKDQKEKNRLISIIEKIKPKGFGVIIRTVAQGKNLEELGSDLSYLKKKWKVTLSNLIRKSAPAKILSEKDRASCILRDTFNDGFTSIVCDDEDLTEEIRSYLQIIAPDKINIVKYYKGEVSIFEKFEVEKQIKTSLGKNVPIGKGAHLVIEHTEALHVIDVNSGMRFRRETQEEGALEVNLLAATEIARQLRLRDIGGIIVVDCIDMPKSEHRKKLYEHLKEGMKNDRAKHKILSPSKFGLIQITRQRVRPELNIITDEPNPNKENRVESPLMHIHKMELFLESFIATNKAKKIFLHTSPFFAAYLKKGWLSIRQRWFFRYKKWIKIIPRDSFYYLEYRFFDEKKKLLFSFRN